MENPNQGTQNNHPRRKNAYRNNGSPQAKTTNFTQFVPKMVDTVPKGFNKCPIRRRLYPNCQRALGSSPFRWVFWDREIAAAYGDGYVDPFVQSTFQVL